MASRFLLWLRIATAFFLFTHLITKGQPSIVRIAEKEMKLCFFMQRNRYAARKKETSVVDSKKKAWPSGSSVRFAVGRLGSILGRAIPKDSKKWYLQLPSLAFSTRVSVENEIEMVNEI